MSGDFWALPPIQKKYILKGIVKKMLWLNLPLNLKKQSPSEDAEPRLQRDLHLQGDRREARRTVSRA